MLLLLPQVSADWIQIGIPTIGAVWRGDGRMTDHSDRTINNIKKIYIFKKGFGVMPCSSSSVPSIVNAVGVHFRPLSNLFSGLFSVSNSTFFCA